MKLTHPYIAITWNQYTGNGWYKPFKKKLGATRYLEKQKPHAGILLTSLGQIKAELRKPYQHCDRGKHAALLKCYNFHQELNQKQKSITTPAE